MNLAIKIADISIALKGDVAFNQFNDANFYHKFIVKNARGCHCRLEHTIGPPPDLLLDSEKFSTQNWQLANAADKKVLRIGPAPKKGKPDNLVVFSRDYRSGRIYQKRVFELFRRFIDQFLITNLLSRNNGFLLHASGVVWNGKGICFTGRSGTGKSTLLDLFKDEVSADCLLNDDRVALRGYGKRWRVFGTPWYGESRVSSSSAADLSALFFIRHAQRNYVRKLAVVDMCRELPVLGLLPLWDAEATSQVLGLFQCLVRDIPAYELGFVPGKAAIDLIKKTV